MSKVYYVSSLQGIRGGNGSLEAPFLTLHEINQRKLYPGDQVLLERGSVFEHQYLQIRDQGTEQSPILIGAYGEGPLPLIQTNGNGIWYQDYGTELDSPVHVREGYVSSCVLLYDAAYITVKDLAMTNECKVVGEVYEAPYKMNRTGVAVVAKDRGTIKEIHLKNLEIRKIHGNVYDKHMNNGGIYITAFQPAEEEKTGVARYENLSVTGCMVQNVSRWGIAVGYSYKAKEFMMAELPDSLFDTYGHKNIYVANNYVKEAGGDAITVMYGWKPLVEHNVADSVAGEMNRTVYRYPENRGGMVAAGIWPWKCKDAIFQYNEVVDTRLNQDGMPWDADSGDGTIYQYNYSRLNEGGCVMFCLEESIHNTFCYNVSEDDLGGTISPCQNPDAYIHHNTFYRRKGVPFVRQRMGGGNYIEEKNIFIDL